MEITQRSNNDVQILDFSGNLDTKTSSEGQSELNKLLDQGTKKILVNFEKLEYISSSGLRILLDVAKKIKNIEGELRICGLNEIVNEVFEISGFISIFRVFTNETEALAGF